MNVKEILENNMTRGYLLRCIASENASFFGSDNERVVERSFDGLAAYHGLHPRLSPFSVTREADMVTYMALSRVFAEQHPNAKSIPQFVTDSVLASEFKPDRKQLYEYAKQSETYKKLTAKFRDSKFYTRENIMDFAGTRRYLFAKVLSGTFHEKYSVEFCVFKKFLEKVGGRDLKQITKDLYRNRIEYKNEYALSCINPLEYEYLFALSKVRVGFEDFGSVMPDIACEVYKELVSYVNNRPYEFTEALGVVDVLNCIMTISCTVMPVKLFTTYIDDEKVASKYKDLISSYFITGYHLEDLDDRERVETIAKLYGASESGDPKRVAKVFNLTVKSSAKDVLADGRISEVLSGSTDLQNTQMVEDGLYNLALCQHDSFYINTYKLLGILWLFYIPTRAGIAFDSLNAPKASFSVYERFISSKIHHTMMEGALELISKSVLPFEVVLESLLVSVMARGIPFKAGHEGSSKGAISEYMTTGGGVIKDCVEEIINANPPLFTGEIRFNEKDFLRFTRLLHDTYQKADEIDGEDEDPEEIFKQMEAMKSSDNFDVEAFSELAQKFANNRTNQGEHTVKREELYKEYLSGLALLGSNKDESDFGFVIENKQKQPETVSVEPDLSEYVTKLEYDEALELMHQAEQDRDNYKRKAHAAETLRNEATKHAYNLERPAQCGSALIQFAKRGYIQKVSEAVAIAEGLSEGKLRILPSAVESAEASTFNLPAKVKDALCLLADHYIEDLERGGIPEARKHHGRSFRGGESETTSSQSRLMDQRTFDVDGEKRVFTTHLAFGNKASKTNHVRIYFDVDMEARQVIIAYVGEHLDTATKV